MPDHDGVDTSEDRALSAAERLRTLIDSSPICIHEIDLSGRIVMMNPAGLCMLGVDEESEVLGLDYLEAVAEEDRERVGGLMKEAYAGQSRDFEFVSSGERPRHFTSSFTPILDGDGRVMGLLGHTQDVTKQLEQTREQDALRHRVEQAQKLESLGLMAGGVAHDFNNLLVGILGNASFLEKHLPEAGPLHDAVIDLEVAAGRAAELTRELVAYSGKGTFEMKPVDLASLVRQMKPLLTGAVPAQVELSLDLSDEGLIVLADANQLRKTLTNLVVNGAAAIEEPKGRISIAVRRRTLDRDEVADLLPGTYALLRVADTGRGIPVEPKARIFEPFFTTEATGRGLGLAVVHGIVRSHGGAVSVDSAEGRGAVFEILLPLSERTHQIPEPAESRAPDAPQDTVLVIDDESIVRGLASRFFESLDLETLEASGGQLGVEMFEANQARVALVLLDLSMPGMSGEETFHALRRVRPNVPILLSSGFDQTKAAERLGREPATAFLPKPYSLEQLLEPLQDLIGRLPGS